jgi:hypothetical protein
MAAIKQYSQQDPKWKGVLLGFDKQSTIGNFGCLLTSIAMVASGYGFSDTPADLNEKLKNAGGFQGAFLMPYQVGAVCKGMSYKSYTDCKNQPAPLAEIDTWLAMGKPVILEVDWSPQAGVQTHYLVAYGKKGDDYLIYDPYPYPSPTSEQTLKTSKYAQVAGSNNPAQIITGVMFFDGPAGAVQPPPPPKLDKGVVASFPVFAAADELAIRSQPLVSDATLIKRVPLNTEMKVLESDASANSKIGQVNQWLAVKLADGTEGYTAAWFVSRAQSQVAPPTPSGQPPAPAPAPKDAPVVKTTVDGLKLRSKPDNTDATVLKLLPLGAELKVLEAASEVKRKVGAVYEWLNVIDVQGTQGVVAAWYVSIVSLGAAAFGPQAERQTAPPKFDVFEVPPVILRTAEEGVALRSEPLVTSSTLIRRLPLGSELLALEAPDLAAPKIGRVGDWIHVRDVTGNEGYVAAWHVEERPADPAPAASPLDS